MRRFIALAALVLSSSLAQAAKPTVILGRPVKQQFVASMECRPSVCIDGFFQWTIKVERHLSGPPVGRRVRAARVQHAEFIYPNGPPEQLYVLEPIEESAARDKLKSEYMIRAWGGPVHALCLREQFGDREFESLIPIGELNGGRCYREKLPDEQI